MALVSLQSVRIAFGGRPLLDGATLQIERGERIGLLGRNGEGKSTLLRIVAGALDPDAGAVVRESGTRVALLEQEVPAELVGTVREVVRSGQAHPGVGAGHEIERLLSVLELEADAPFEALSGGQKRRALLGRALASEPDVLLLDEPTNHLDLDAIDWLESFLLRRSESLLFVTHDRVFLQRLATRIVELDRGHLTSWDCDYPTYLRRREERLAAEEGHWAAFDALLAKEEAWIRQGIKARRTRNEGRVRALEKLRRERTERRERIGSVRLTVQQAERTGRKVIEARGVTFAHPGRPPLVRDLSVDIRRGDRIGLIGPNGAGKTTLLRLLLGQTQPDEGTVVHGGSLEVAYFDQHREQLDERSSVAETVGMGSDWVTVQGERRHVLSYLQDFLFTADRAKQPIGSLSGGERSRVLLARLLARPANVLVLDEPTNDLDAETLELLEAALVAFDGTVLVVSHDRAFLDNLCTSCLVFEGKGVVREYVGGYTDWRRTVERREEERAPAPDAAPNRSRSGGARGADTDSTGAPERARKLSFSERREWDALPARIEELEAELARAHAALADPAVYRSAARAREATDQAAALESQLDAALERWAALGERAE